MRLALMLESDRHAGSRQAESRLHLRPATAMPRCSANLRSISPARRGAKQRDRNARRSVIASQAVTASAPRIV